MALKNGGYENSGNLILVKLSQKDKEDKKTEPHFITSRKVYDKWVEDSENYKSISGDISKIDIVEYEYEGNPQKSVKILLRDKEANEAYLLSLRPSILGRDIFNKILGLKELDNVEISVYTNKKGYATSSVRQNGNLTDWKFNFVDLPKPLEITHPKTGAVISRDYSELDELFLSAIKEFAEKFEIFGKSKSAAVESKPSSQAESPSEDKDDIEDWD